jgi:GT2 family glycosyltransferase
MLLRTNEIDLAEPQILAIGGEVMLAAWDGRGSELDTASIGIDGIPAERSRATLRIPIGDGSIRTALAFRVPGRRRGELRIGKGGPRAARMFVDDAPASDPSLLVEGLDEAGRARLFGFVFGVCRGTFRISKAAGFADFCRRLTAAISDQTAAVFAPKAHLAAGHVIYQTGPQPTIGAVEAVYATTDRHVFEVQCRPTAISASGGEIRILIAAPAWLAGSGVRAFLIGSKGAVAARFLPYGDIPSVASLAECGALEPAERHYTLRCLGQIADGQSAEAARALQILAPEPVRELVNPKHAIGASLELSASCGDAGVFVRGWIRDPHGLAQDAELLSPFGQRRLAAIWRRLPRPDLEKAWGGAAAKHGQPGFVALAAMQEPVPVLQHRLRLLTAGGPIETVPPLKVLSPNETRDAVLGSVAARDLTESLLEAVIAPATAVLHRNVMAEQREPEVVEIGRPNPNPAISMIVPLYRNLSFLRLQAGAFAIDPEMNRDVELIYVLDSPEQRVELEHLLRGLHVVTGLPLRLVVMSANFGFAAANNTGVRAARGRTLMLLNSDVVPIAPGWLGRLRAALAMHDKQRPVAAAGPKLLFDDGSLQHAGLTFERDIESRWYNAHFFKGYPRDWPAANLPRSVPGITGAAMMMPRAVYEDVGGFSEDYVVGDYEDSDLCLKIRSAGFDIRYEPRAELYHFERRSIDLHAGYVGTAASAYNRRLHAGRWSPFMDELAAVFEPGAEAQEPVMSRRADGGGAR